MMNRKKLAELITLGIVIGVTVFAVVTADKKNSGNTEKQSVAGEAVSEIKGSGESKNGDGYTEMDMESAKKLFETEGDYIILDVRRPDEFAAGHIPGAINVANEEILDQEPEALPDKEQVIYVYCRSGNRSKQASKKLAALGYKNIVEFGGIIDWTGEIEK